MKLPRAIPFDLDDTIHVAFGPARCRAVAVECPGALGGLGLDEGRGGRRRERRQGGREADDTTQVSLPLNV